MGWLVARRFPVNSTFNGIKMLLFIPFVIIVFFVFSRMQTTQAVSSASLTAQKDARSADIVATPDYLETRVVAAFPVNIGSVLDQETPTAVAPSTSLPPLDQFIKQVADGRASDVCGLYIQGITALKIVQQPKGNLGYIDQNLGTATQFQSANVFGAVGLLAHNFLAGRDFFRIKSGQDMVLVNGDGSTQHYQVSNIADYQRLTPTDLRSNFLELASSQQMTADQVFGKFYRKAHHLVLQTCILNGGNPDWGVRFIDGNPVQ
jgi:hypothetical protein